MPGPSIFAEGFFYFNDFYHASGKKLWKSRPSGLPKKKRKLKLKTNLNEGTAWGTNWGQNPLLNTLFR